MVSARYSNIAGAMPSDQRALPRLAAKVDCVSGGLADITQETAEELRRVMMEQCHQIIQKLMPLMDETAPGDVLDGILKGPGTADEAGWHAPGRRLLAQHRQAGLWRQRGRYYRAHQGRRARAETRRTGARAASAS